MKHYSPLAGDISWEKVFPSVLFPIWGREKKIKNGDIKREKEYNYIESDHLFPFAELCEREVAAPSH